MEEENVCSSLLALTDSVLQLTQQDSWTPLELQPVSGNQTADMWAETEAAMEQVRELCQRQDSQTEAGDSPEDTEQWEQIMWPVRPLSCTSPQLSFATVEWDVSSPHVAGCGVANQLDARGTSRVDAASLSLHHFQDVEVELLAAEGRAEDEDEEEEEEKIWINSPLLDSVLKETTDDPEPCDAVDEQGPPTQEKEDSTHELLDALTEVPLPVDAEPEDECAAASDLAESVGSVDFTDILEDEDEALSFVHLKLEEEPDVLRTRQEDLEDKLLLPHLPLPPSPPPSPPPPESPETEKEVEREQEEIEKEEVKEGTIKEQENKETKEEVKEDQVKEEKEEKEEHSEEEVKKGLVKEEEHKEKEVKKDQVKEEKEEKEEHREEQVKEKKEAHREELKEGQVKEKEEHREEVKEGQVKEKEKQRDEEVKEDPVKEEVKKEVEKKKVKAQEKKEVEQKKENLDGEKVKEEVKEEKKDQNEEQVEQDKVKEGHQEEKEDKEKHRQQEEVKAKVQEEEEKEEVKAKVQKEEEKEEVKSKVKEEVKAKVQEEEEKEEEEVGRSEEEEKHEEEDVHSARLLANVNVAADVPLTDQATLTDAQPAEISEERQPSALDEDAEAPEELHEGLSKESEMCKDAELNSAFNPEVVTIPDSSGAEDAEEQQTSCMQQLEVLEQLQHPAEERDSGELSARLQHLEPSSLAEEEKEHKEQVEEGETTRTEGADRPAVERAICAEAEPPTVSERREQTEPAERKEQTSSELQPSAPQEADESEVMELQQQQPPAEAAAEHQVAQVDEDQKAELLTEVVPSGSDAVVPPTLLANGKQPLGSDMAPPHANGAEVDRGSARRLAERLFNLDGIQRVDVVKHVDKDNDFSRAVGEEYLKLFDFTGQTLDRALRSFLKVVVLIGETQERERVLQHFSCRFHQCNPDSFPSAGPVLALTCALMLLNTDLHGQNVGKSMSSSKFVSNLDGMNEGENFGKDLLKSLYNSIKSEPLQWAIDEGELMTSMSVEEGPSDVVALRSKTNPFQDVPHDKKAVEVKEGLLQRKIHADVDGKRTPWGKRGWKTFNGVLRGMVLYLQKVDYRSDQQVTEEVISVHHSLAERAADYTKKPHVFRLQTADWRVFLIQATCKVEMYSWITRINLISALHSSPPFPAAVGSQRRFSRPILPSSQSAHTLERQLQSYSGMLESFRIDLSHLQSNPPEGKKAKAKDLEEHRTRAEYLQHEVCRYETYVQVLEAWKGVKKTDGNRLNEADLCLFDKAACADSMEGDEEEDEDLKRSHSSPALELEAVPSSVVKVKRNISERRTYRKPIIPRSSKDS